MSDAAYLIEGEARPSRWLVTCDHATNRVPPEVNGGCLGLPEEDMARHIAYDVGAAGLTSHLASLLDAPAILSRFSRLVIDPNRGEDDPTLLMKLYDGTIILANRHADADEVERRLNAALGDESVQPRRLVVGQRGGLFHEHHRDAVADLVRAVQSRVEQHRLCFEVIERPLVFGAGQDGEEGGVETHGGSVRLA